MCLTVLHKKIDKEINYLENDDENYIILWKVFDVTTSGTLSAQFNKYSFREGKNTARGKKILVGHTGKRNVASLQYKPGFHCFLCEKDAKEWFYNAKNIKQRKRVVLPIKVKKSWITSTGLQNSSYDKNPLVAVVCKHIFIDKIDKHKNLKKGK
jgi:hypothetical protein